MCFLLVLAAVSLIRTFAIFATSIKLYGVKLDFQTQGWRLQPRVIDHFDTKLVYVLGD